MTRLAAAGITSVLAVPDTGLLRGQSALVNVAPPPEPPQISNVAPYRRGVTVIQSPVAGHIAFTAGAAAAGGYPGSLLGTIAFVRQALYDARWQRDARAWSSRHQDQPRPVFEPALDALVPLLDGRLPAAFSASQRVEIERALAMAAEFTLASPIIVGGLEASDAAAELKAGGARVIYSLNFPSEPGRGRGAGRAGRGGAAVESARARRIRLNAPSVPAALLAAGIPFAFGSNGLDDQADFLGNVRRAVRDGGLAAEAALQALTSGAATLAGAGDRLGTLAPGKIANLIVTDGDLFADATRIRHVFVDGYAVDVEAAEAGGRGGRRGQNR
jgi:hypothetical protein